MLAWFAANAGVHHIVSAAFVTAIGSFPDQLTVSDLSVVSINDIKHVAAKCQTMKGSVSPFQRGMWRLGLIIRTPRYPQESIGPNSWHMSHCRQAIRWCLDIEFVSSGIPLGNVVVTPNVSRPIGNLWPGVRRAPLQGE